ncbi:MAG TPA: hypothetical protein VGM01_09690 [Ktedonobacteraceae bacterium]|jgi:hypothetical protein
MSSNRLSPTETCRDFAALLPLASYHLLSPDDSARLNAHVATCAFCRGQLASYEQADAALAREFAARQRKAPRLSREEIQHILNGRRIPLTREQPVSGGRVPEEYGQASDGPRFSSVSSRARQPRRALSLLAALLAVLLLLTLAVGIFSWRNNIVVGGGLTQDLSHVKLDNLAMVSTDEGWAIGDDTANNQRGVILHYVNGQWAQVSNLYATGVLWGIFMLSSSDGWIVGDQGVILHYDGQNWRKVQSPVTTALGSVFMLSPTEGWAAGDALLHYSNGVWTRVANAPGFIYQIQMLSSTEGWAVGPNTMLHYSNGAWTPILIRSPSNGSHMKPPPNDSISRAQPLSISMLSSSDGWAVGLGQENMLRYQQGQWRAFLSPNASANLQTIAMVSADEGWTMGIDGANNQGVIYHYIDGKWTSVTSPTNQAMTHLVMLSPNEGWAVGTAATILHYSQGAWSVAFAG